MTNYFQKRHIYGKYILNEWNLCGFKSLAKPYNTIFKQTIISSFYSDFWVLPETHCLKDDKISLESYTVYHYNRIVPSKNRRGSGGIAIAVHKSVLETHVVVGIIKGIDGQLGLKLRNNLNDFLVGVIGLYLSPDSYIYGQDPENFFNQAAVLWDDFSDCDLLLGSGDLNARTKEVLDFLPDVDGNLSRRTNPDKIKNAHGGHFLTFLKDNRAVILNGRVTPELNDYTFVSTRGTSVPDYIFCPLEHLQFCTEMKTLLVRDVTNELKIPPPQSLPDHSILSGSFTTSFFNFGQSSQSSFEPFNTQPESPPKKHPRKNLKKIDEAFFMSEEIHQQVLETISRIENVNKTQTEIDSLWTEIKNLFLNEMETLPDLPTSGNK